MAVPLDEDKDVKKWRDLYEGSSEWLDMFERGLFPLLHNPLRRHIERTLDGSRHYSKVIEIGCGTGRHLGFVQHTFDTYVMCDRSSKHIAAARSRLAGDARVEYYVPEGNKLKYPDGTFDRLLTIDTLEHIPNPWEVVQEWARVVRSGGLIDLCIPTEGGFAWRLGRHLTTRRTAIKKHGIDYDFIVATEHVNTAYHLLSVTRHYFKDVEVSMWPLGGSLIDLNIFVHMRIRKS